MIDGNQPAFPVVANYVHEAFSGMTLRQWYAGLAMQGLLASESGVDMTYAGIQDAAFRQADAMLDEPEPKAD